MKKILMIDDDPDFLASTADVLEAHGYEVTRAPDGQKGYDKAKKEEPDLVLLDVMMTHDTEGFDLARRLREDPDTANLPVIIMTGIRRAKGLPFSFEPDPDWLPVKAVLEKPVKPEALIQAVRDALGETGKK